METKNCPDFFKNEHRTVKGGSQFVFVFQSIESLVGEGYLHVGDIIYTSGLQVIIE